MSAVSQAAKGTVTFSLANDIKKAQCLNGTDLPKTSNFMQAAFNSINSKTQEIVNYFLGIFESAFFLCRILIQIS